MSEASAVLPARARASDNRLAVNAKNLDAFNVSPYRCVGLNKSDVLGGDFSSVVGFHFKTS